MPEVTPELSRGRGICVTVAGSAMMRAETGNARYAPRRGRKRHDYESSAVH
jgi:hypothetical protein